MAEIWLQKVVVLACVLVVSSHTLVSISKTPGILKQGQSKFTTPLEVRRQQGPYTYELSGCIWNEGRLARYDFGEAPFAEGHFPTGIQQMEGCTLPPNDFTLVCCINGSQHEKHCNVSGTWVNELGSVLNLSMKGPQLSGFLHSSVETSQGAAGDEKMGKVVGVIGDGRQPTFTMSVKWSGGSVSTWAGQCFWRTSCPVLRTIWLLRSEVHSEDKNWEATRIGEDLFRPQKACDLDQLS